MPEPSTTPVDAFLDTVSHQLRGLDDEEKREVLQELTDHIQDAQLHCDGAEGAPDEVILAKVVAALGDPAQVGRRIREEHLAQRLPLRDALVSALPSGMFFVPFLAFNLLATLFPTVSQPNLAIMIGIVILTGPVLALGGCLWSLSQGRKLWLATLLGYSIAFVGMMGPLLVTGGGREGELPIKVMFVLAMLSLPALALIPGRGQLLATLAVLGAISFVTQVGWVFAEGQDSDFTLGTMLGSFLGLAAIGAAPRRWYVPLSWCVLLMAWCSAGLSVASEWAYFSRVGYDLGPLDAHLLRYLPYQMFALSAVSLLMVQLLSTGVARRAASSTFAKLSRR